MEPTIKDQRGAGYACSPAPGTESAIEREYGLSFCGVLRMLYLSRRMTLQAMVMDFARHGIAVNKSTVGRWLHGADIPLRKRGNPLGRRAWPSYRPKARQGTLRRAS